MKQALLLSMLVFALAACGSPSPVIVVATTAPPLPARTAAPPPEVVVYVTGAVSRPGVYRLQSNSRVQDAVKAAGGFAPGADMPRVNLAARVRDEEEIFVPRVGEAAPALPASAVNINSASATQLRQALGIPSALATKIVAYRRQHGPFSTVDDLRKVPVSDADLQRIRPQITAG